MVEFRRLWDLCSRWSNSGFVRISSQMLCTVIYTGNYFYRRLHYNCPSELMAIIEPKVHDWHFAQKRCIICIQFNPSLWESLNKHVILYHISWQCDMTSDHWSAWGWLHLEVTVVVTSTTWRISKISGYFQEIPLNFNKLYDWVVCDWLCQL